MELDWGRDGVNLMLLRFSNSTAAPVLDMSNIRYNTESKWRDGNLGA